MEKKVTGLFILLLAALIFYGGAGVNIVTYCCNDCRTEGIAVLQEQSCCEVHGHEHSHAGVMPETTPACETEDACCDMERVSFDWNSSGQSVVNLQPVVVDLMSFGISIVSLVPVVANHDLLHLDGEGPPIVCPRTYLSLLTTLLI